MRTGDTRNIVSYCFTTSNHNNPAGKCVSVEIVSYCFTTSNHNKLYARIKTNQIVSYCFTTSNHNLRATASSSFRLYLIASLHQTTTSNSRRRLIWNCILLLHYIKPQRRSILSLIFCVLRCPTPDKIRCCALRQSGFDAIFTCENSECQRTDAAYKCIKKIRVAAVFRGGSARSCPRNCGFRRTVGRSRSKEW